MANVLLPVVLFGGMINCPTCQQPVTLGVLFGFRVVTASLRVRKGSCDDAMRGKLCFAGLQAIVLLEQLRPDSRIRPERKKPATATPSSKRIARNEQGPTANAMPAHTIPRDVMMRASGSSHRLHHRQIAGHVEEHVGDAEQSEAEGRRGQPDVTVHLGDCEPALTRSTR